MEGKKHTGQSRCFPRFPVEFLVSKNKIGKMVKRNNVGNSTFTEGLNSVATKSGLPSLQTGVHFL